MTCFDLEMTSVAGSRFNGGTVSQPRRLLDVTVDELSPILSAPLGENSTAPAWLARCINKKVNTHINTYDICRILYTFVLPPNQHKTTNPQTPGVLTNQALIKKLHWWHQVGLSFGQDGTLDATSIGGSGPPKTAGDGRNRLAVAGIELNCDGFPATRRRSF